MCLTFLRLPLLSLQHVLLWGQGLLQELHVELILLLHLPLLPQTHLVTDVALEPEAKGHHGVANTDGGVGRGVTTNILMTRDAAIKQFYY